MSLGLLVVRLKYGLYVGHLSKWFVLVLILNFLSSVQWLQCRFTLTANSFIYATNIHKFLVYCWLGIVFLLQIIKRTFGTYMCVNFGGFTAVVTQ